MINIKGSSIVSCTAIICITFIVIKTIDKKDNSIELQKEACHLASSLFSKADDETKIKAAKICIGVKND